MRWRLLVGPRRLAVSLACGLAAGSAHAGPGGGAAAGRQRRGGARQKLHRWGRCGMSSPQQRQILTRWPANGTGFPGPKQRLLNVAKRYPDMSPDEQLKIQARLPHWTELPQTTRDEARNNMKNCCSCRRMSASAPKKKLRAKACPPPPSRRWKQPRRPGAGSCAAAAPTAAAPSQTIAAPASAPIPSRTGKTATISCFDFRPTRS